MTKLCIECRYPVKSLYTSYSKADDRALGKGVRLTQCPRCKRFADKYVEHDFVVLFIDLVLIKPQVYRHLLFNRLGREDDRFDPSIIRLSILLLLFDVYLTWARIEKSSHSTSASNDTSWLSQQPLLLQYVFFLAFCTVSSLAFHLPVRLLCSHPPPFLSTRTSASPSASASGFAQISQEKRQNALAIFPYYPHPTPLSTALLVSSCTKLFPLLLIVWDYDLPSAASAVSWAVIVNNVAALEILMDCGYLRAALLVSIGAGVRAAIGWSILRAVGITFAHGGWVNWGEGGWAGVGAAIGGW